MEEDRPGHLLASEAENLKRAAESSPDIFHSGSSAYTRRGASHSRSHSQISSHRNDTHDDYYEGDSTVEYEGDLVAQ
ncbi:hypothetical protein FS749_000320 [Ceratobasidium sp. UAMH 11750]|nr:hypothetical protein FS749_000320 [Ceratobasidium sp. UAMH 11750]